MAQAQYTVEVLVTRWTIVKYFVPAAWRAMGRLGLRRNPLAWWCLLRALVAVLLGWRGER